LTEETGGSISNATRRYALLLIATVYVFNFIDRQILAILLPAIKAEFGVDDWVLGFLAGSAFCSVFTRHWVCRSHCWLTGGIVVISSQFLWRIWSAMTALSGAAGNVLQLALARIGVGVGEAGYAPPAHSMIADYYPPEKRSSAMGIFTLGISLDIMIAYLGGGWMAQNIGWRQAFLIVGLPGLTLALIFRFTVTEPPRGLSEGKVDLGDRHSVRAVAKFLLKRKSFVHLSLGAGISSFTAYAVLSFFPSFLERSHGLNLQEIGAYLGIIIGVSTGLGYVGGGYFADKIGLKDRPRSLRAIAGALLLGWVFIFPLYLLTNPYLVMGLFFLPSALSNCYLPTTFAQTQSLVGIRMRSVASAILLFVINTIGLGLGPQAAGILSDYLAATQGTESLRYSLLIIGAITGPWTAWHFYMASRYIDVDLARVEEV